MLYRGLVVLNEIGRTRQEDFLPLFPCDCLLACVRFQPQKLSSQQLSNVLELIRIAQTASNNSAQRLADLLLFGGSEHHAAWTDGMPLASSSCSRCKLS